jgi:hypothetical protein
MGYAFQAYAVDEYRIRDFWRSGREELVSEAMASPLGAFRRQQFPNIAMALREIANGTVPVGDQPDGGAHLYATEILCALWGAKAGPELRLGPRGIEAASELKALLGSAPVFYQIRTLDFPVMCGWGATQVERRLQVAQRWPARLTLERETYNGWLRAAAERKVSLVAFYY